MRFGISVLISVLLAALLVCLFMARRSKKSIKGHVAFLIAGMSCPVIGNLILIISSNQIISIIGCYIYFIGMDVAVFSLLHFTYSYCEMEKPGKVMKGIVYTLLLLDVIHYALNPFLGLSFSTEKIIVDDLPYYRVVPYLGQVYHRIACYSIFAVSLVIFIVKTAKASRVYREKYAVIMISMAATALLESYYIFSRQPIDISMIGFALFALIVYFFSIHYRPMKLLDRMLAGIASDIPDSLFFFDKSGKCIWTNEPGRNLIGIKQNDYENVKDNLTFLFGDIEFDTSGWFKRVDLGTGDEAQYTYLAMRSVVNDKNNVIGTYLSVRDITEEQREIKREMYKSTHDAQTDFYTKEYLYQQIDKRLNEDKKTDYMIGYLEISNFKLINDVFGQRFAEITVKKVAELILEGVSKNSLYGRLSVDSFGILIDKEDYYSKPVEEKLTKLVVKDENLEHHVIIHYGVYDISDDDDIDVPLFFNSARLATAKLTNDQAAIVFYDDKIRSQIVRDQILSNQLQSAIEGNQIRPYLQPIVDSRGMLAGAEALVRWIHPEEGFMNPGSFIPLFERNGLIADVDKHMWKCACEILSDWKSRGIDSFISINISPKDFYFMDVVTELKSLVEKYGIDPVKLRVEITETVMVSGSIDIFQIVKDLREYGFIVEMDDFGSGYSSLNLLKDLNFDVIKIDMQFLKDSERNRKAGTIIEHIIKMSEDLEMDTLTEGVETAKQFEKLYTMGCKLYQGYYFSKPIPVEDFEKQWFD